MNIIEMLDELFDEINDAKKAPLSSKKMVDGDKCLDLIDDIRDNLPAELERAANIVKERRQILADGENEAQQYMDEAKKQAAELVKETEIVKQAQLEADKMISDAKQNAKEIRLGAKSYANEILEDLESCLAKYSDQVARSKDQFSK